MTNLVVYLTIAHINGFVFFVFGLRPIAFTDRKLKKMWIAMSGVESPAVLWHRRRHLPTVFSAPRFLLFPLTITITTDLELVP